MSPNNVSTVRILKESLTKNWKKIQEWEDDEDAAEDGENSSEEILNRLDEMEMTLEILTETLIGTVVSKFKSHERLGDQARALVKKWKKVAAAATAASGGDGDSKPAAATSKSKQAKKEKKEKKQPQSAEEAKKPTNLIRRESSMSHGSDGGGGGGSGKSDPSLEWQGLESHRQKICQNLYNFLVKAKPALLKRGVNGDAIDHLTAPRAAEIEDAIFSHPKLRNDRTAYMDKARSLAFNLKKNLELCQNVILGSIEARELVTMSSEQLISKEVKEKRESESKKLIDSKRLDWDQANEDKINEMCGIRGDLLKASLFTCARCKSVKTTSTQKQTRSADEPMTVFVLCLNCGKRWKC